jgi:hypothetical protein
MGLVRHAYPRLQLIKVIIALELLSVQKVWVPELRKIVKRYVESIQCPQRCERVEE